MCDRRCVSDRGELEYKIQLQCLGCSAMQYRCSTPPPHHASRPTQCDINTRSQCRTSPPLLLCNKMNWHNTWCFTPPSPPQPVMKMVVQFSLSLKLREDARVLWSGMDNSIFNYRTPPPPFSPISNALLKTISGIIRAIYLSDDYRLDLQLFPSE